MSRSDQIQEIILAGIEAVRPAKLLPDILANPPSPEFRAWLNAPSRHLLCIGKASLAAADVLLSRLAITDHFIISSPNPDWDTSRFNVSIGSHPIPDENSLTAAKNLLVWLSNLPKNSNLLIVLSGGASALMVYPLQGISLQSKIAVNDLLIRSGASIHEINAVRKHLSQIKGGRLGKVINPECSVVFVISDVIGDDLSTIGSGPFFEDPSSFRDAKQILNRYGLWLSIPADVRKTLEDGIAGRIPETPKPGTIRIPHFIIASNQIALNAAASRATELGYHPVLGGPVSGFVEVCADQLADQILALPSRAALILGGEVTVRLTGEGVGGRNQHLALLLSEKLAGRSQLFAAAGTDGIDGNSTAAGAWTDGTTLERARKKHLDVKQYLESFDSFHFFQQLNQNIVTGPTGTNVMDLYLSLGG